MQRVSKIVANENATTISVKIDILERFEDFTINEKCWTFEISSH